MIYTPSPTGEAFLAGDKFIKLIMGPVGGGKSTVCLFDLLKRAREQEPFGGVRRTKFIVLRNTMAQLKSTVKPLITQWLVDLPANTGGAPLGQWRLTENVFEIDCFLEDGTGMHTELCLLAADTPDDVRRLLSLEASAAWVEECREVEEAVFKGLLGRVARFPNRASGGVTYPGVICSTNPPPMDTYWQLLIEAPPSNVGVFKQPAALLDDGSINPLAENLDNLDPDYYGNLIAANTGDWVDVYLKNLFGPGSYGQPVFKSSFKAAFHRAESSLKAIPAVANPIIVGIDNGLQAAAVVMQQDARGRVNVLSEALVPEDVTMGFESFLDRLLLPHLLATYPTVARSHFLFVADPACFERSQLNEATLAQAIQARGYRVVRATTNDPGKRVVAAEGLLTRAIDGKAGMLFDTKGAAFLLKALEWGYRYKKNAGGQMILQAEKNHYSHTADAFQYACLYFNAQAVMAAGGGATRARTIKPRAFAYV